MKRLLSVCVAVVLALVLSVSAFAYTLPNTTLEDGNTVISRFCVTGASPSVRTFLEEWKQSGNNALLFSGGSYYFVLFPAGSTVTIFGDEVRSTFYIACNQSFRYVAYNLLSASDGCTYSSVLDVTTVALDTFIGASAYVSGTHPVNLPSLPFSYVADYPGNLLLRFDDDSDEPPPSGGNWWDGLLGWLADFWQKLKDFFISIFVPDEGYFSEWFETIRAALDKKVGGLTTVIDSIRNGFDSLKSPGDTGSIYLKLPDDLYYDGFKGKNFNLLEFVAPALVHVRSWLNAIVVIFTCIYCYKKLIGFVNT